MIRLMPHSESFLTVRSAVQWRIAVITAVLLLAFQPSWGESPYRFDVAGRVVAFADVHGGYDELVALLRGAAVIDTELRWQGGNTHLVSTGDLIDRGPDSRRVLDLLMRLEAEAAQAGGAVHVGLGNHEVLNLVGDLRYVTPPEFAAFAGSEDEALREQAWKLIRAQEPEAPRADFDTQYPPGYFARAQAFSPSGRYGAWLLSKPFLIVVNGVAFVHGGLPGSVAEQGLDATNQLLHSQLDEYLRTWASLEKELSIVRPIAFLDRPAALTAKGAEQQSQALLALQEAIVFTPKGPTWYRGQALCYPYSEAANLDAALAKLKASRVVEGHTISPTGRVLSRFDGRVILLDTGMLQSAYHGTPAVLVQEGGQWSVIYADRPGQRSQPEVLPRAVGPRPAGMDDDALERWLAEAEVVDIEDLDTGVTNPRRVTLRKDGVELRAVLKQLSTAVGQNQSEAIEGSDRFEYELAAYRLDRLLALDMVPVTVERTLKGRRGVLQFWIDDSINVRRMLEQKKQPSGWCEVGPQYNLMNIFDVLIQNSDRTQENALFTSEWTLVLIDHTRAFRLGVKHPTLLYRGAIQMPPSLAARLSTLTRERLTESLGPYLRPRQIDALLKRRDKLLQDYDTRAAGGSTAP